MEDDIISKPEKQSSIIPALGLLGLGLGIIALALGIISMIKVGDTAADMNDKIEKAAALSLETKKISDRIDSLAMQIEAIKVDGKSQTETLISQVNAELKKVYDSIADTRNVAGENRKAIEEIAKRGVRKTQPQAQEQKPQEQAQAQAQTQAADTQTAAASGDAKTHKIQSGDTFAKLAKKYGVSLDAIIKANPSVNPSRLRIGQEIAIP